MNIMMNYKQTASAIGGAVFYFSAGQGGRLSGVDAKLMYSEGPAGAGRQAFFGRTGLPLSPYERVRVHAY